VSREHLYDAVSKTRDDHSLGDAVLTGFLVIAEWVGPEGQLFITYSSGDHDRPLPPWRTRGFASEVLFGGSWVMEEDDEEDDDVS